VVVGLAWVSVVRVVPVADAQVVAPSCDAAGKEQTPNFDECRTSPFGITHHLCAATPDITDEQAKEFFRSDTCSKHTPP
jgi:hypothetical protein